MIGCLERDAMDVGGVIDDRYAVKREIARGGIGVVLEAEHIHLGSRVALKLVAPSETRRLLREARALSRCRHPHVVEVHDAGIDAENRAYVALAMLEGRSLDGLLAARTRLGLEQSIAVLAQIAGALDHVHAAGVVHRDIKPSNLMVVTEPGGERVVLIDFGIASLASSEPSEPKLTHADERLGTYEYMAPEQFLAEPTSARSDVYSAAVTFYECVAGQLPFPGGRVGAAEAALTARRPTPLPAELGPSAAALDAVLARALAPRPEVRPQSVGELLREVSSATHIQAGPVRLHAPAQPERGRSATEGRRFARAPYVTPARLLRAGRPPVDGRTEDVSEGGLLMVVGTGLGGGERVEVRFSLPTSGQLVTVPAITRWVRGARSHAALGLEFEQLAEAAADDIRRFVGWMRA